MRVPGAQSCAACAEGVLLAPEARRLALKFPRVPGRWVPHTHHIRLNREFLRGDSVEIAGGPARCQLGASGETLAERDFSLSAGGNSWTERLRQGGASAPRGCCSSRRFARRDKNASPRLSPRTKGRRLLGRIRNPVHRARLATMYACGLRIGEAVSIEIAHVDGEHATLSIVGKGDKHRKMPLPLPVLQNLRALWRQHHNPRWLFPNKRGSGPLNASVLTQTFRAAAAEAGLSRILTPHALRHSYATRLLATSRRKIDACALWSIACRPTQSPPDGRRARQSMVEARLRGRLLFHRATDVDDIVGDDAEPDPAVHSDVALVAAAVEAMAPLDHADAPLASGAPLLAVAEPALPLLALALGALGRAIGNADAFDALCLRGRLVLERVECGVRRHQARRAAEQRLMCLDRCDQQIRIIRPLSDRPRNR